MEKSDKLVYDRNMCSNDDHQEFCAGVGLGSWETAISMPLRWKIRVLLIFGRRSGT
jgi:hypothetical protein